ncbi:MAG: carbohydrate ABC transporter permease [Provencibacterium sp.]|jgi:putative aldouronate transport system permease protein|nr:carbohydrate ABC transporter permease [Provencibacterium sp.]
MKSTRGEKIFYFVNHLFLGLVSLTCLLPLLYIIATSLSSSSAVMSGKVYLWPVQFTLESYDLIFRGTPILRGLLNSLTLTLVGVLLSMVFTILAAYPLSKDYLYARKAFTMLMVFTMLFGGGLIPSYLVVKSLGLINSYWSLWLPGLVSTYNMIVLRTFFTNIPRELEEAARMDGCGELRLIVQIFLPLSLPCIATLSLFYAVSYWNMFRNVLIYINSTAKYNLAVMVNNMIQNQTLLDPNFMQAEDISQVTPQGIQTAGVIVMVLPIILVYPFLQKYFVKGVMIGSVKG